MKTKEELTAFKAEVEALNKKLAALTDEELAQVTGGNELTALKNEVEALNKKLAGLTDEDLAQAAGGLARGGEGEKQGYDVACFPGLSGFP